MKVYIALQFAKTVKVYGTETPFAAPVIGVCPVYATREDAEKEYTGFKILEGEVPDES